MRGEIKVFFDTDKNEVGVSAPMETQALKNMAITQLLTAVQVILNYKPPTVITPAQMLPKMPNGVTH